MEFCFQNIDYAAIGSIATAIGAVVTAVVMIYTVKTARAAQKSTELASKALKHAQENSHKDEFTRHFTLLLEQHESQQNIVKMYLDSLENSIKSELSDIFYNSYHEEAWRMMKGHEVFSPYMRILYHLIKHISEFHEGDTKSKKKYSSIVRSLIRNDVMYLIAINVSYVRENGIYNQYEKYQKLLVEVDFFAHAIFSYSENLKMDTDSLYVETTCIVIRNDIKKQTTDLMERKKPQHSNILALVKNPFVVSMIIKNPNQNLAIESFNELLRNSDILFNEIKQDYLEKNFDHSSPDLYLKQYMGMHILELSDIEAEEIRNGKVLETSPTPMVTKEYLEKAIQTEHINTSSAGLKTYFYRNNKSFRNQLFNFELFNFRCDEYKLANEMYNDVMSDEHRPTFDDIMEKWKNLREKIMSQSLS